MSELVDLMQAWIDAEPSRKATDLARAMGVERNTVYGLMSREPKEAPRKLTLQRLARALELPYPQVRDAAYRDIGQRVTVEPTDDPAVLALVDALDGASPAARRAAVEAGIAAARAVDQESDAP